MKELSDDVMTKRIKEVVEPYEPDYSPPFWDKIRKQRPVPELWLTTLMQGYRFWLSVFTLAGVLSIVYMASYTRPADNKSAVDLLSPGALNYSVSEKATEITSSEKTSASGNLLSSTGRKGENIPSEAVPARQTDPESAANVDNIPAENAIAWRPERIENNFGFQILPDRTAFDSHFKTPQLISIGYRAEDIRLLKVQALDKSGKVKLYRLNITSLVTKDEDYNKFTGPNKLAIFYSPEIHFSDSLKTVGISQGMGVTFEGQVRSLVSVSAGLSYQAIHFDNKTIFSEIVPPRISGLQPNDTNRTFQMLDSIGIRSGSYEFLEVPVSLNFKFLETTRSKVWLGIGISSIAFLRQQYNYETSVEGISESSSSISIKAWENIHPLASVNFSLLYRYNLGDRFQLHGSLQYKQHLVKMGYNSMKLNRLNLQVGLIYRFGRED